ncbi:MAG: hypothetical protein PVS3B1_03080 [Ktedonobacteraceae bacterium]
MHRGEAIAIVGGRQVYGIVATGTHDIDGRILGIADLTRVERIALQADLHANAAEGD